MEGEFIMIDSTNGCMMANGKTIKKVEKELKNT